jgi:hypothetical protein
MSKTILSESMPPFESYALKPKLVPYKSWPGLLKALRYALKRFFIHGLETFFLSLVLQSISRFLGSG